MWCCSCSRSLFDSVLGFSDSDTNLSSNGTAGSSARTKTSAPDISLDSAYLGHEVVVVKNGLRVCGTGGALGSAPLVQTKSYFEVKYQQDGQWGIGVATRNSGLDTGPLGSDPDSWILRHTGELFHNAMCIGRLEMQLQEGDILGVSYDHIELIFYVNGVKGNLSFSNVRGTTYPAVYVNEGAVLDVMFDGFSFPPPNGFDRILKEKSILYTWLTVNDVPGPVQNNENNNSALGRSLQPLCASNSNPSVDNNPYQHTEHSTSPFSVV